MRILVTGASGLFGGDIADFLARKGYEVISLKGRAHVDLAQPRATMDVVRGARPDVIVHAGAWRDIDKCEMDPEGAYTNNVLSTRNVMVAASELGCKAVHISSDAVFDGNKNGPYHEFDATGPVSIYGRTKLLAESEVRCFVRRHFIVRVPLLFGLSGPASGNQILKTVEKASKGEEIVAASDQTASPTFTHHAAAAIERLFQTDMYGTYHVCNKGSASRWDVAVEIVRQAGYPQATVRPVASAELRRPGPRQRYCVMTSLCLKGATGDELPDWRTAMKECIDLMRSRGMLS